VEEILKSVTIVQARILVNVVPSWNCRFENWCTHCGPFVLAGQGVRAATSTECRPSRVP